MNRLAGYTRSMKVTSCKSGYNLRSQMYHTHFIGVLKVNTRIDSSLNLIQN